MATTTEHRAKSGPDGKDIESKVGGSLDYLSQLARKLHIPDPVEQYFSPVVGRWNAIHDEAARWRKAADTAEHTTTDLKSHLGKLDAAWQGKDAEAFIAYIGKIGLAGTDMSDAMRSMATALDKLADGIREMVQQMAEVLTDGADDASQALSMPVASEQRVREFFDDLDRPTAELFESVRDALRAFVKLCDDVHGEQSFSGVHMKHSMPEQKLALPSYHSPDKIDVKDPVEHKPDHQPAHTPTPAPTHESGPTRDVASALAGGSADAGTSAGAGAPPDAAAAGGSSTGATPTAEPLRGPSGSGPGPGALSGAAEELGKGPAAGAAAAAASAGKAGAEAGHGGMGMPMMPMMGGMGGGMGGDQEYKSKRKLTGDITEIFGEPEKTAPPVIGEEPPPPKKKK